MKRERNSKRDLLVIAGATLLALSVFYVMARRQSATPSPATLRFRMAVQFATEVRLYNHVSETGSPNFEGPISDLQSATPVFRLRGRDLNEFMQRFNVNEWRVNNGLVRGATYEGAYAAEFYNGSKCIARLRFLSGMARWYSPNAYVGEGELATDSKSYLENRLGP